MLKFHFNKGVNMKIIKHEVKLEKSVKVILGAFAFGIILNAFLTPVGQEFFGISKAEALTAGQSNGDYRVWIQNWPR